MPAARTIPLTLTERDPASLLDALPPGPGRFLLESGPAGPANVRRFSYAGAEPFMSLVTRGRKAYVHEEGRTRLVEDDPFVVLQSLLNRCRVDAPVGLPFFPGGAVGFLSYDAVRVIERLPIQAEDDLGIPDLFFSFYDVVLAIDQVTGHTTLVLGAPDGREAQATSKARRWAQALKQAAPMQPYPSAPSAGRVQSDFTRGQYIQAVEQALAYISAGDIFQVNLSQRLSCDYAQSGWQLYRRLRDVAPAPFSAFMEMGSWQVVSGSPERLIRVDPVERLIETRPIKGTRPRGATEDEDQAHAAELMASEKDQAELLMIVDLQRNDLGRVCEYGSVHVPDLRRLEQLPNVWHTVATVQGRLRECATTSDILRATFPGGSITGAPKIRAMEIIEELEPVRRGLYTGAIGYLGFDGRIDLNIAIRTALVQEGKVHFHVGGGIVADSDPQAEYDETIAKATGMARALGVELRDLP